MRNEGKVASNTILLIEDNPGDARLIRELLREAQGSTPRGGAAFILEHRDRLSTGLERFAEGGIDAVLLDLSLPDSHGLETLSVMHTSAVSTPILVLTGLDDEGVGLEAVKQGAQDYLMKGQLDGQLLIRSIRYAIERNEVEKALLKEKEFLKAVLQNAGSVIVACDADGVLTFFDRTTGEFYKDPTPSDEWAQRYGLYMADGETLMDVEDIPLMRAFEGKHVHNVEMVTSPKDHSARTYLTSGQQMLDANGRKLGAVVVMHDITERKTFEQQLQHQAFHDSLTGLPNRALFTERLSHALVRAERSNGSVAVLFLDLDNFKVINDSLGHRTGDRLLFTISKLLQTCVRPEDTVARLGGDEFTVLLEDIAGPGEAIRVAQRIEQKLRSPIVLGASDALHQIRTDGREVFVTTSMGIAVQSSVREDSDDLLRQADIAMYAAKDSGKARFAVFEPSMTTHASEHLRIETELRRAIERGEFKVYYQPIVSLTTGKIDGVEALLRWQHPQRGLVPPLDFIPLAEETGLIVPIGQFVLEEACRQACEWQERYSRQLEGQTLTMSVNLSARQFMHPQLIEDISRTIRESGIDPHCLKLEITESIGVQDIGNIIQTLDMLRRLGIELALDDFGTGYSALSYLKRFPISKLKLDRSFVAGLGQDTEDTAIVHAVIAFAKALGLSITAEGIETAAQVSALRALDCDLGQGFFFARPMPQEALSEYSSNAFVWDMV
jgi:diguanylate cyclase (GGDEF)-like protein